MNISDYVGVPYGFRDEPGSDCFQIVRDVAKNIFGYEIPDYAFSGTWQDADKGFNEHKPDFDKVETPEPGDIVLLKIGGKPIHCGIVINKWQMLHTLRGSNSCLENFNSLKWGCRIEGFYRWNNN